MSLTSFLKSPGIEAEFQRFFPFKEQSFDWPMLAPPLSPRPQRIGTAFDYLLRFHLQKLLSDPERLKKPVWIASAGVASRRGQSDEKSALEAFKNAAERFAAFQNGATCDEPLIESCLHLAQFDEMFREGSFPFDSAVPKVDIEDMSAILQVVPWHRFETRGSQLPPIFNPTFGLGSAVVGGADADFWLDETLFELKTVRAARLTARMHFQLLGYCVLHELSPNQGAGARREIRQVAIYFSRFGKIMRFNVNELIQSQKFDEFLLWFAPCGARRFGSEPLLEHMRRYPALLEKSGL